jgi:hypothetical protein
VKPARVIVDRDVMTSNAANDRGVELTWHDEIDPRRVRRVAEILADILDNAATPDESGKR